MAPALPLLARATAQLWQLLTLLWPGVARCLTAETVVAAGLGRMQRGKMRAATRMGMWRSWRSGTWSRC